MLTVLWVLFVVQLVSSRPQNLEDKSNTKNHDVKVTLLPFYGGGKGQSLQITELPDGTVNTEIIKTPTTQNKEEETIDPTDLENPQLPNNYEKEFGHHVKNIQKNALAILDLQKEAEKGRELTEDELAMYQEKMNDISDSSRDLTKLQEDAADLDYEFENREGLSAWFERKQQLEKKKSSKKESNKEKFFGKEETTTVDRSDNVEINTPPPEASVAEANPVGLAVAGEGGVAASKPIATAVVGPGGLAIARPVGTAIAGVAPDQALVPLYAESYVGVNKPRKNGSSSSTKDAGEYLRKLINKYHPFR